MKLVMRSLVVVLLAPGALGAAPEYSFVNIADSSGAFASFDEGGAVNASGVVAFRGILDGGGEGVYVWDGMTAMPVAETSDGFASFERPAINRWGAVSFGAAPDGGGAGIYKGTTSGGVAPIAETSDGYTALSGASLNDAGTVSFVGTLDNGVSGIFEATGGVTTPVIDDAGTIVSFLGPTSLNNSGQVAFAAQTESYAAAVFRDTNDVFATGVSADEIQLQVSIGDNGWIAYRAGIGGVEWLGVRTGVGNLKVASGDVGDFDTFGDPVINGVGELAFTSVLDSGAQGLFILRTGGPVEIIGTGDALFGSTVVGLTVGLQGLNDSRDVAFGYELADGRTGIALAQIPGAGTGLVLGAAGAALGLRRRRAGAGGRARV